MLKLIKSRVKAHTRVKGGKVEHVKAYEDSRKKRGRKPLPEPVVHTDKKGNRQVLLTKQGPKRRKKDAPRRGTALKPGVEAYFRPEGAQRLRRGKVVRVNQKTVTIEGKRNAAGETPTYRIPKKEVMTVGAYKKATSKAAARKTDEKKYTSEGDRANAHFNVTKEEMERRRKLVEKRIGDTEAAIINHPGFKGVAFKISSELAKENGISTALVENGSGPLWHRAKSAAYQEVLMQYFMGAMKSWRQEISKKLTPQVKKNIAEFKTWLKNPGPDKDGKYPKSYIATTAAIEGRRAAIRHLQQRRKEMGQLSSQDFSDQEEDPEARRMISSHSRNAQQEHYLMAKRGETVGADIRAMMRKLAPVEAEALKAKFGLPPYEGLDGGGKLGMSNEKVSGFLNRKGYLDGKNKWTRNSVGKLLKEVLPKIKVMPEYESLKFWVDVNLGRELNYVPPHKPTFHAGTTTEEDYEEQHGTMRKAVEEQACCESEGSSGPSVNPARDFKRIFSRMVMEKFGMKPKTLAVDFDGVIADYSSGFLGKDVFGQPLPGAAEALRQLYDDGWNIIIFTTRPNTQALRDYLYQHDIPYDAINMNPEQPVDSNHGKPIADVYLDDRAVRFHDWEQAFAALREQKPMLAKSERLWLSAPLMRIPADMHPEGSFAVGEHRYEVAHEEGEAVLRKSDLGFDGLAEIATYLQGKSELAKSENFEKVVDSERSGLFYMMPEGSELSKSFSSDMQKQYPGGRWVTIKQGPLSGRHIFILPHADGSATVLVGGGPAMRHKVLTAKKDEDGEAEKTPEQKAKEEKKKDFEVKPKLSSEEEDHVKGQKKEVKAKIAEERKKMADIVREKAGIETELTDEDREMVEKKVAKRLERKKKAGEQVAEGEAALEKMKELRRIQKEKQDQMEQIVRDVKLGLLHEEVDHGIDKDPKETDEETQRRMSIAAAVKDSAEELAESHYKIKAMQKQSRELSKMLRVGKSFDRFKLGEQVAASYAPIPLSELKKTVADEKALQQELDAHYKLVKVAKGIEGVTDKRLKGERELKRNIAQGGFEALTGLVGGITGNAIMRKDHYEELGATNAAILAKHYLKMSGHDPQGVAEDLSSFITDRNNPVALQANERGRHFMEMAEKVRKFGQGSDNLMTLAQALGTSKKYSDRAFEAFGQAEGALNQGAELVYAMKNDKDHLEITANNRDAIDRKRRALGLKAKDVSVRHIRGEGYRMVIPPRSFDKLLSEKPTDARGYGDEKIFTPAEVKAGHANTDDFRPTAIREYTPEDKKGVSRKIVPTPEQQAAARLVAQQKRVYLNFEAGTGKSFAAVLSKAHVEDVTGKPQKMIVAMPSKLMPNFKDEVAKFSDYNVVIADSNSKAKRIEAYNSDPNTIVLVNKEKFNFDEKHIREAGFNMVVSDEAHKITQREGRGKSMMSQGLKNVAKQAEYYIPMSGTPTPSDLSELYFHANLIDDAKFGSQKQFMDQFKSAHRGVGYKQAIAEFMNHNLDDHVFTVKKKLDTTFNMHRHEAKLSKAQQKAYKNVSEQFRTKQINPLQRDQQYSNILNSHDWQDNGKFDQIHKIVQGHMKNKSKDEKVIFYAKNRATLNQIKGYLKHHYPEYDHVEFTGTTKKSELDSNKKRFKHDPKVKFSLHMRAGVEGLNLQYDGDGGGATTAIAVASGEDSYAPIDQFFSRANRKGAKKDIDGHLVLTDTPHDMGTQVRLEEKKAVGELVQNKKMGKPKAGTHLIRPKGGKREAA